MTTPTPDRWSAETEELVAQALSGIATSRGYRLYEERFELAEAALTALADAGLLLPPGLNPVRLRSPGSPG